MQSSRAMRAWPHFVPRLELSAELQAIHDRIDAACKRLDAAETQFACLPAQTQQHLEQQRLEVAARMGEMEEHAALNTTSQVASLRTEVMRGLQDLQACAAAETAVRERMLASQEAQFETLGGDIVAVGSRVHTLEAELTSFPSTYASQSRLGELLANVSREQVEALGALQEQLNRAEVDRPTLDQVHGLFDSLHAKQNDLQLKVKLASNCVEGFKRAVDRLEFRQVKIDTSTYQIECLRNAVADMERQMGTFREEQKILRIDLAKEQDGLRRQVQGFQQGAWDLKGAMELLGSLDEARAELQHRCEDCDQRLESLAAQELSHWEQSLDSLSAQERVQASLAAQCQSLQQELAGERAKVKTQQKQQQATRQSVNSCVESMDVASVLKSLSLDSGKDPCELPVSKLVQLPKVC